jgi:hypothetical protein
MGEQRNTYNIFVKKPIRKRPFCRKDIHIHFRENAYESANGLAWFRIGSMAYFCECGHECSDSIIS